MFRLFILIILLFSSLFAQDKLKVVFPKNFPPSHFYIDGKPTGYAIDLINEISKDLNLELELIVKENWQEVVKDMKSGNLDIVPNQGITEDRKKYMNYSVPIQHLKISIFQKSNQGFYVKSVNDILEKSVAIVKNNACVKIFKNYKNINTKLYENKDIAFDAFNDGKVDLLCYPEDAVYKYLKENSLSTKVEKSFEIFNINRAIAISKKHPELVNKVNSSLENLRKNGKLKEIYEKWHEEEKSYSQTEFFQFLIILGVFFLILSVYLNYKKIILTSNELENEVKKKTKLLNESKEQFEFAAERALNGYWEWNLDTNEIKCSHSWCEVLGLKKDEFKPSIESIQNLIHKDDQESNERDVRRLIDGIDLAYSQELRLKNSNGEYLWFNTFGTIYENMNNERIFFGFLLNINDKKRLEKKRNEQERLLLHQSKMASMGEMLENIAHQWRQPLSMISTSATGVEFQKEMGILKDEYLIESLKNINESTQYLSTTIDDFRNYFSSNKLIEEFDLKEVIDKVLRLISSRFKNSDIDIIVSCENEKVFNLENELIQVILNLLNNSKDALDTNQPDKKVIFINTHREEDNLCIEIQDNAGGIKEEYLEKVFEPYFTTKHQTQGTGLGLFMCDEILHKHMCGNISVKNVEFEYKNKTYKGAKFIICIKNL